MTDSLNSTASTAAAKAMRHARISDGEGGTFPLLFDLLDFSGENKAHLVTDGLARAAVTAYLAALPAIDAEGLVERLSSHMGKQDVAILLADCREAADTITRLSREVEEARGAFKTPPTGGVR